VEHDNDETLLEILMRQLGLLVERALDRIPGQLPLRDYKFLYLEIWLHAVTSLLLLLSFLSAHGLIFSVLRRKAERRRERCGEDFPALFSSPSGAR
jgi:Flp pilus assembly protein TadB